MKKNRNEILARILTKQNVTVIYKECSTASVDMANKIIHLPIFDKKYSEAVEDFMLLHETLHLLHTPNKEYQDSASMFGGSLVNVLEDIRIEYLGRNSMPGLLPIFQEAAEKIAFETPLFQAVKEPKLLYNGADLIVRMNYYFRFGHIIKVPFSADEIPLVKEAMNMRTFRDVQILAKKLSVANSHKTFAHPEGGFCSEGQSEELIPSEEGGDFEPESRALRAKTLEGEISTNSNTMRSNVYVFKKPVSENYNYVLNWNGEKAEKDKVFVDSLIKQFQIHKNSINLVNQRFQKQGSLDFRNIKNYKVSDNIFKKRAVDIRQQNHGFICFIDSSASMSHISNRVCEFIANLCNFFDHYGIPYVFYAWGESNYASFFSEIINSNLPKKQKVARIKELYSSSFGRNSTPLASAVIHSIEMTEKFIKENSVSVVNSLWITDGESSEKIYADVVVPGSGITIDSKKLQITGCIPYYQELMKESCKTTAIHIGRNNPEFFKYMEKGSNCILVDPSNLGIPTYMKNLANVFVKAVV